MDQKLHSESMRAVEKSLASQRKSLDPAVAKAYQMCQMNMFLSKTVSSAVLGMGVYGVLGLVGRRAPAIAQYKTIPSMFSYTIAWDYLSSKLDSMCVGSMMSVPEGIGPELRRIYAEQYTGSPYLQAAQDIADAAKQHGDVRMGRAGQLVPATSSEAIMVATPELLMQWRLAAGSKGTSEQPMGEQLARHTGGAQRGSFTGGDAPSSPRYPGQRNSASPMEQSESDDGFLAADNERHSLDIDASAHSRVSNTQDSAGVFAPDDGSEHYDHEASGRFEAMGSSLAPLDVGMDRRLTAEELQGFAADDDSHGEFRGAMGLPSMPSWGDSASDSVGLGRGVQPATGAAQSVQSPSTGLEDDESFALRRRLAMRGQRPGSHHQAPMEASPRRPSGDFDEDDYFGRGQ